MLQPSAGLRLGDGLRPPHVRRAWHRAQGGDDDDDDDNRDYDDDGDDDNCDDEDDNDVHPMFAVPRTEFTFQTLIMR